MNLTRENPLLNIIKFYIPHRSSQISLFMAIDELVKRSKQKELIDALSFSASKTTSDKQLLLEQQLNNFIENSRTENTCPNPSCRHIYAKEKSHCPVCGQKYDW